VNQLLTGYLPHRTYDWLLKASPLRWLRPCHYRTVDKFARGDYLRCHRGFIVCLFAGVDDSCRYCVVDVLEACESARLSQMRAVLGNLL